MHHVAFATLIMACVGLRWSNVWNGYRVGVGRTESTFVAIAAWCAIDFNRSCYWCSMQHAWGVYNFMSCGILLSKYTVPRAVNNGLALIFVG